MKSTFQSSSCALFLKCDICSIRQRRNQLKLSERWACLYIESMVEWKEGRKMVAGRVFC